jgi:MFS family permease
MQLPEGPERWWIRQLSGPERAAFIATFGGWMLDGMDVMVYSLVLPTLLALWHITRGQAGVLSTVTLLLSSLGGWLAGVLADRYGRVQVLKLTIFWFAFFTFLSGFTQNFYQLLFARGLQGLGFGGEWAVGAALMGETIRARYRGRAVGTVQAGWAVGWGLSVILFIVLFSRLPHEMAWRVMFWIGILPALLIVYIRGKVHEPEVYRAIQETNKAGFLEIFSAGQWRTTLLAAIVALGAQGGYHAVTTWLPLYLSSTRGLTALNTGGYLCVVILGSFLGYLTAAHLTDAIGRKRTLILFAACSFLAVIFYAGFPISDHLMLVLGFPLGFFPSGSFSPMGAYFSELFPTSIRASGAGFAYNLGRGTGALFPTLVGYLSGRTSLGIAISVFGSGAFLIMILGVLFLPETRGLALDHIGREGEGTLKESA